MTQGTFLTAGKSGVLVCAALLLALTGCMTEGSNRRTRYPVRSGVQIQATLNLGDGYDYYPRHEVYFNRRRNEYVYRDGRSWVRRPAPRGMAVEELRASPSVRLDFNDAPARHHSRVVKTYPRTWAPPPVPSNDKGDREEDRRNNGDTHDRK